MRSFLDGEIKWEQKAAAKDAEFGVLFTQIYRFPANIRKPRKRYFGRRENSSIH
jgi:hypothetical protein